MWLLELRVAIEERNKSNFVIKLSLKLNQFGERSEK